MPLDGNRYRSHMSLLPPIAWQCHFAHVGSRIETEGYDVVQAETSNTWAVARMLPVGRRVLVLHDDDASRLRGLAKTAPDLGRRAVAEVTALKYSRLAKTSLREADRVWLLTSSVELARLGSKLPDGKARLVPNGAGDELWSVALPDDGGPQEVLFIAPGFYEANVFGLASFLRRAWPLVKERVPRAHLRVVGVGWEGFGSYPDVSFVGWRDSLADEYSKGRLAIAPLFAGGGTKLKVVEAMASGRPVVASSTGAEGVVPSDGVRFSMTLRVLRRRSADSSLTPNGHPRREHRTGTQSMACAGRGYGTLRLLTSSSSCEATPRGSTVAAIVICDRS